MPIRLVFFICYEVPNLLLYNIYVFEPTSMELCISIVLNLCFVCTKFCPSCFSSLWVIKHQSRPPMLIFSNRWNLAKMSRLCIASFSISPYWLFWGLDLLLGYLASSNAKSDVIFLLSDPDFLWGRDILHVSRVVCEIWRGQTDDGHHLATLF